MDLDRDNHLRLRCELIRPSIYISHGHSRDRLKDGRRERNPRNNELVKLCKLNASKRGYPR